MIERYSSLKAVLGYVPMNSIQKSWLKNSLFKYQIKTTTKKRFVVVNRNASLTM